MKKKKIDTAPNEGTQIRQQFINIDDDEEEDLVVIEKTKIDARRGGTARVEAVGVAGGSLAVFSGKDDGSVAFERFDGGVSDSSSI